MRAVLHRPLLIALIVASIAASACGGGKGPSTPRAQAAGTAEPSPEVSVPVTAPLTGVPLDDPDAAERPPVAVKIENTAAARPQAGLDAADVVYEELTEGGVTRFLALFHSSVPDLVGPIRSGRPEDAGVLPAYDPVLYISGARPDVLDRLREADIEFRGEDGRVLFRDTERRSPHNVFAHGPELFADAAEGAPAAGTVGWAFSEDVPEGAVECAEPCTDDPGRQITVSMSPASVTGFRYDPEAGVYRRLQDGLPQVVTGSGAVGAANVVVLATEVADGGCCDPAGNRLTETRVVGEGRAIVLRDGRRYEGRWVKDAAEVHVAIAGPDGSPLPLRPGPTWVLLAPATSLPPV